MVSDWVRGLGRKADWFIPDSLSRGDAESLRRARMVVWFTFFFVPFNPMTAILYAWSGLNVLVLPVLCSGLVIATCPLFLRYTASYRFASNLALIAHVGSVMLVVARTGGVESPILWWLGPLPFVAGSLLGARGCVGWCTVGLLAGAVFFIYWPAGLPGYAVALPETTRLVLQASTHMSIVATLAGAFLYGEHVRVTSLRRMEGAHEVLCAARDDAQDAYRGMVRAKERTERALCVAEAARAESEEANRIKGEVLRMAAHDLRGPLGEVSALGGLVLEDEGSSLADTLNYVGLIVETAEHMQVQLGQVLELNQIEVGKIEPEFFEVWVSELVQGVVETFVARASQKDMTLRFEMDCPDILAMTDIMLASRVLENLVSNAVKYSPLGSVVSVFVEADGDGYAIGVREGGPGLSIDDQEKLYRPFSKLTPAPTAGEPSTGVGLSIVKSLVVLLGGTIECDSHLGEGTTFRVSLPGSPEGSSKAGSCEIWDSSELGRCA